MSAVAGVTADERIWDILAGVMDPEIPVVSLVDLGIIREVSVSGNRVRVKVTPTYVGCPATEVISRDVETALRSHGFDVEIRRVLSPARTTDWISDAGKRKLAAFGIAPPRRLARSASRWFDEERPVACPRCASLDTDQISEFGSTPCKALHRCGQCLEPFDYFKCL